MKVLNRFRLLFLSLMCFVIAQATAQSSCSDKQSWCGSQQRLCKSEVYKSFMTQNCKKTCNFCNDETPVCESAGCDHDCDVEDGRALCSCLAGFRLNQDGRTCSDIDECARDDVCTDPALPVCKNTEGSYVCTTCLARPGHTNYYQSNTCCRKTDITSCGQNSITGVQAPPGPDTILGQWPWTTLVLVGGRPCTGAIISGEWIVAAAHCFSSSDRNTAIVARVAVRSTSQNESNIFSRQINVDQVIVHDDYAFPNHNVALLHLERSVETSWATRSICLPNGEYPQEGTRCWMSGFEAIFYNSGVERTMKESGMTVTGGFRCEDNLGRVASRADMSNLLCARYDQNKQRSCTGETGGPIVCQRCDSCEFYLAGMMSFGDQCPKSNEDSFATFSSLDRYEEWISRVTRLPVNRNRVCASVRASWRPWTRFSSCSRSCGGGEQSRSRVCVNGEAGDPGCTGARRETRQCNDQLCPRWSRFGAWSACSVTCGEGRETRTRSCLYGSVGDVGCHNGRAEQSRVCSERACPSWGEWALWSACDQTCGSRGVQTSQRACLGGEAGEGGCIGAGSRQRECNRNPCPSWGSWSPSSACQGTCGAHLTRTATRVCQHGNSCEGDRARTETCGLPPCPTIPSYTEWSPCSVTCGSGRRSRRCIANCVNPVEEEECVLGGCGGGVFSAWSDCSVSCGVGVRTRRYVCLPNSTDSCSPATEVERCQLSDCDVAGVWGEWTVLQPCDVTCGEGITIRQRECIGGSSCEGEDTAVLACNLNPCPTDPSVECATAKDVRSYCPHVRGLCKVSSAIRDRCPRTCLGCE